jgi:transcriptional regulator with PAS, ATPase and Fis domain
MTTSPPTPEARPANQNVENCEAGPRFWALEKVIQAHVAECLLCFNGDRVAAAKALGIGKTTLYRWLKEWGNV